MATGSRSILTEGSLIERFKRDHPGLLHPDILNADFIYDPLSRRLLGEMYKRYLEIAISRRLPMLIYTPTWRASSERLARAGLSGGDLNGDNVRFLRDILQEVGSGDSPHFVGGLMACRGDAYRGDQSLSREAAREYHTGQAENLAAAGIDFFQGSTQPALPEAMGLADAMGATGVPVIISFVVLPGGTLLDGTPLGRAVATIDEGCDPAPFCYLLNCVHPSVAREALDHELPTAPHLRDRVWGLQANTSRLEPDQLDDLDHLDGADPTSLAEMMLDLKQRFGWRILGGCCGTDHRHIEQLADRMIAGE